jgi:regulator of protease activity HflC (stomatin/prohibitin superfamily)
MQVRTDKYEADASAASKDLQIVHTKIAVNYHPIPEAIPEIYKTIGLGYADRVIQPAVQEMVKSSTSHFTAEELITKREEVKTKIEADLKERLSPRNIIVESVSITNFDFSDEFNKAIELKVVQEQTAMAAKNKLAQIQYEAQQTVETAKGQAESTRQIADANSYSIKVKADGDAYALQVVREQLEKSNQLIEYKTIEKWTGEVPTYTGSGAVPFININ